MCLRNIFFQAGNGTHCPLAKPMASVSNAAVSPNDERNSLVGTALRPIARVTSQGAYANR